LMQAAERRRPQPETHNQATPSFFDKSTI